MTAAAVLLLVFAALCGAPLFVVIAAAGLLAFHVIGVDLSIVVIEMYRLASNTMLVALLLFSFAGYVLAESRASGRLVRLSTAVFGRVPGGLGIVALLTCSFFTALTGASGMTIVALGGILLPSLLSDRYPEKFSLGLLTSCGSMGLLFPPSLPLILFGMVADVRIQDLFVAGILPGLLMTVVLGGYVVVMAARFGARGQGSGFAWRELGAATLDAWGEILIPVVVLGGVFSGFLAVSEAAAVTAFYVVLVETVIRREVRLRHLGPIVRKTVTMVGAIVIILGASLAFNSFLVDQQVPERVLDFMRAHVETRLGFLILLNLFLLVVGCVLDIFSALVVVAPLIVPISKSYGVDPVHLGIVFLANLQIGYMTPPIGMGLFIAGLRFEKPILKLYAATIPFVLLLLGCLALITFIPELSLLLVR